MKQIYLNAKSIGKFALLLVMLAVAQSSWAGGTYYYYNKYAHVEVVPSAAGTVYCNTKNSDTHEENMTSETSSNFDFKYCTSAGYDELYFFKNDTPDCYSFRGYKVINVDGSATASISEDDINNATMSTTEETISNYKVSIADKTTDDSHDGVLNGIYVGTSFSADSYNATGWHTNPDAYVYFFYNLNLTDKEDLSTAAGAGKQYVKLSRNLYEGWNSVCLPFAISKERLEALGATDVKIAGAYSRKDDSNIYLNTSDAVAAGVPCYVYVGADCTINFDEYTDVVTAPLTNGYIKGSFTNGTLKDGVYKLNDNGQFALTNNGAATITAYRSYIDVEDAGAKILNIYVEDIPTGICEQIATTSVSEGIYTSDGIKIKNMQKGLNIVRQANGITKKVLVK